MIKTNENIGRKKKNNSNNRKENLKLYRKREQNKTNWIEKQRNRKMVREIFFLCFSWHQQKMLIFLRKKEEQTKQFENVKQIKKYKKTMERTGLQVGAKEEINRANEKENNTESNIQN